MIFDKIYEKTGVYKICVDPLSKIPNLDCETVYIFDQDSTKKTEATKIILDHFLNKHQRQEQKRKILRMLINEDLVPLFIGSKGKNIKRLMD